MAEVLLSCEMLEDEMQLALQRTGVQMPIVWLDAGLHEYPAKLRASLREKIAELEQYIEEFDATVDAKLQISNCITKIEVPA